MPVHDAIVVLDFGGQYTTLIARRIRELNVYSEIRPFDVPAEEAVTIGPDFRVRGIVLSGGPASVYVRDALKCDPRIFELGLPILGICYGHQLIAHMLGGEVKPGAEREYGKAILKVDDRQDLLADLADEEIVWMSHWDQVVSLPPGFEAIAHTDACPIAAYRSRKRRIFGVQFHPEVEHTEHGLEVLRNFAYDICECEPTWTAASFVEETVAKIQEEVGDGRVLMAVSGGVDSTVAAALIHRAVGDRLHCIFVDNGLLRMGEAEEVVGVFEKLGFEHFYFVDAGEIFLSRLKGIADPEEKRRVIAFAFVEVLEEKARELERRYGRIEFLGQGTTYPDRIESAATSLVSAKIKSHHNVILMERLKLKPIEPIACLFKDEVRRVGRELGLPEHVIKRHPFPGPALAVRILGEITKEKLEIIRQADRIIEEEVRRAGLYDRLWQAFAVLLPVKSVGIMGDFRTYEQVIAVRAVTSSDAMTADWAKLPYDVLERIASRIVNEVRGVNRVVYDVTSKPPATIEWE